MDSKTTISISEGRKRIFEIAEEVQKPGKQYTLTEKGRAKVAVMSAEERDSLLETVEVLRIFPDLDKHVAQVHRDIKSGAYKKYPKWEDIKANHAVSNNRKTQRSKSHRKRSKRV